MEKDLQIKLVKKAKKGDAHAFVQLCEMYQVVLYNAAYKLLLNDEDVADCLQETEIRAWQKITNLKNEAAFNTWIFRIMVNSAKDILKKRVKGIEFEEKHVQNGIVDCEIPDLTQELNALSEIYRIPLVLYYYAGFSIKEISEQLKMSTNTVKTRLMRGRVKLKNLLEEENNG
ncbi:MULTISPECIES: RNA polymerase sigma factor [unclassified Enterococcus]|uniref:RNA polymerase sigma factor n=1 Tax=unclassified Enterococcus TaxID=2608891 RepID=UPI001CE0E52F|nr:MULTISPECIES: RNA polymerase sigma factor [unclassified Enterococcus]MCA5013561.1 RNA polymerase sigma factor [Enterococcus sp. S23]MCA5016811.1 RNA polymerase sigma factor [Enterococcus sp. S22(2020)]